MKAARDLLRSIDYGLPESGDIASRLAALPRESVENYELPYFVLCSGVVDLPG